MDLDLTDLLLSPVSCHSIASRSGAIFRAWPLNLIDPCALSQNQEVLLTD